MPKKLQIEKEDRLLRLWLLANRDHPEWAIEKVHGDIYLEEFEGREHEYRQYAAKAWPEKDKRSVSWLTKRLVKEWKGLELPQEPDQTVVKPWDENWGDDPARIRILSILFDLATEVVEYVRAYPQPVELQFPLRFVGFPTSVCDWVCKLSAFFDLQSRCECYVLLHFAYVFAADEQYATTFEEPMSFEQESSRMLMRWHKRNQEPDLTQRIFESEGVVSIPIWEQPNEEDMIWAVASHLNQGPWVLPPINMGEVSMETVNREYETIHQPNWGQEEKAEVVQEELLDGAYRVISMATTDQMIMPTETPATGDTRVALTQDGVLKLVSELLEDPGTLTRERAAELAMDLVAMCDEILNRHVGQEE